MLLRNKKLIPHDSSRGKTRNPVECEGEIKWSSRDLQHLQASTATTTTVNQEKPVDYDNSNFASLAFAKSRKQGRINNYMTNVTISVFLS